MKLLSVIRPEDSVILNDTAADRGLFIAFDKSDNALGVVIYDSEQGGYKLETATNGMARCSSSCIKEDQLDYFLDRLHVAFPGSYLKYMKTYD